MKNNNPICPDDLQECNGFSDMHLGGKVNCYDCPRHHHGVRATGAMPGLEQMYNAIKKLIKKCKK